VFEFTAGSTSGTHQQHGAAEGTGKSLSCAQKGGIVKNLRPHYKQSSKGKNGILGGHPLTQHMAKGQNLAMPQFGQKKTGSIKEITND